MDNIIADGLKRLLLRSSRAPSVIIRSTGRAYLSTSLAAASSNSEKAAKIDKNTEEFAKRKADAIENGTIDYTFRACEQDYQLLNKIDSSYLKRVCREVWQVDPEIPNYSYLEEVAAIPKKLPVRGAILERNMMWINLACRAQKVKMDDGMMELGPVKYITFFLAPNLPFNYLSQQAMESLSHDIKSWIPEKVEVQFFPPQLGIDTAYLSPPSSFFAGANILGNNILKRNKLGLHIDYRKNYVKIIETVPDEAAKCP